MFEKLDPVLKKYEDLEYRLSVPDVISDTAKYGNMLREFNALTPLITLYRAYLSAVRQYDEAVELTSSDDEDIRELARLETAELKDRIGQLTNDIRLALIPKDPEDDCGIMVEIRAGTGGDEAALFCRDLYRMYAMYAADNGFKLSVTSVNETELGGYRSIVFLCEGTGAFARFKFESGIHRVQRVPETESQGRIQTSAASVAVLPVVKDIEIEIRPEDIVFESCKSSGAGGQHINKTESAVRLTHKPSGIVIECQQERSQFQNKDKALAMLKAKLYDMKKEQEDRERSDARRAMVGSGDRSQKIRTYNFPQSRVTDHRINFSIYNLDSYMNGNIGPMISAMTEAETAQKLKEYRDSE